MSAQTKKEAKKVIAGLNLELYIEMLLKSHAITKGDAEKVEQKYRKFLFQAWFKCVMDKKHSLVPSQKTDLIWSLHSDDSNVYSKFCNALVGHDIQRTTGAWFK